MKIGNYIIIAVSLIPIENLNIAKFLRIVITSAFSITTENNKLELKIHHQVSGHGQIL